MAPLLRDNALYARARRALGGTQRELAGLLGVSTRSIIRWQDQPGPLSVEQWSALARATHPKDREVARALAALAGQTLESLGLERPTAPPRPSPSPRDLADSIVCAAAEAVGATPQAMRPALVAAFVRACAVGLTAEQARDALQPPRSKR